MLTMYQLIILIRHGESEGNRDKSVNSVIPNHLVALTDNGHQQAIQAGHDLHKILKPDDKVMFYSSPYKRARQTAQNILDVMDMHEVDYTVYEEPRIREQDFGNFQGTPKEMLKIWKSRARYGHFFYRIPNGESAADVYDRCAGFNESLFRQFSSDSFPSVLVLVTHGIWARVFIMKWFRWTYEKFESLRNVPHCKLLIMEKDETTERYVLKTRLRTWSDSEEEIDDEDNDCKNLDDLDRAAIEEGANLQDKERALREAFKEAKSFGSDSPNRRGSHHNSSSSTPKTKALTAVEPAEITGNCSKNEGE